MDGYKSHWDHFVHGHFFILHTMEVQNTNNDTFSYSRYIDLQTCPILTHSTNPPKNEWPKQWCWLQRQWVCTFLGIMNDFWFYFTLLLRMFWNHINAGRKIQVALCCYVSDLNIRNEGILSLFLKMLKLWLLKCLISN